MRYTITLFLTEKRAFEAADWEHASRLSQGLPFATHRVVPATMRDHDGSVDHGFKVMIVPGRNGSEQQAPYYL